VSQENAPAPLQEETLQEETLLTLDEIDRLASRSGNPSETLTNVVDLMAALRKSLDAASASKKKPAKAELTEKKATAKAEPKRKRA